MSSHQIDPRLYRPAPTYPNNTSSNQPRFGPPGTRLPPIDQTHQLPPLSNNAPLQQPYYRLPPATAAPLQRPTPTPLERPLEPNSSRYDDSPTSPTYDQDEPQLQTVDDAKRSRACEACRGLKVRCDRDENSADKPCKRCAKARRQCVITAPSRKRQKKTDSRVAELEKKIDELSADLKKHRQVDGSGYEKDAGPISPPQSTYSASTTTVLTPRNPDSAGSWKRELEHRTNAQSNPGSREYVDSTPDRSKARKLDKGPDVETYMANHRRRSSRTDESDISNSSHTTSDLPLDSIVDQETAARIFDRYVAEMAQHLPAVMFESGTTANEIRSKRPILFLAILDTASVGMLDMDMQLRLNEMLLDVYANSILRNGEKSLDLIQALMVSTIWYRPPKRYEQMNVYMLTHISALMALDFGMGRKLNASRSARVATNVGQAQTPKSFLRSDSVEARRTWLGCYFVCMNVSLSLRRPNFIRWNNYLDECIKVLESAPETLPSDKRLCQHVKLMHINEEVGMRFSMDDPSATIAISDPRVQFAIGAFEKRLDEWATSVPKSQWDLSLEFSRNFSRLYMHEIALHNNHNIDDFRAPFTEESLKAPSINAKSLTPYHQGLLKSCLTAIHVMLRTFSSFDLVTFKALPIFYFVRVAYAVVVMIKLRCAAVDPTSELPFKDDDLQVEYHLDTLLRTFQRLASEDAFRPARMFMVIISKLNDGFKKGKPNVANGDGSAAAPPFATEVGVPDRRRAPHISERVARKISQKPTSSHPSVSESQPQQYAEQQQPYPHHQQHLQNNPYSHAQTPLHFLSEVATNDASHNMAQPSTSYQQPIGGSGWYQNTIPQQQPGMMMGDVQYQTGDPAFDQAMDMTMSIGEGDLSSLFMEGNYGYGPGVIPEGHMGVQNGGSGW